MYLLFIVKRGELCFLKICYLNRLIIKKTKLGVSVQLSKEEGRASFNAALAFSEKVMKNDLKRLRDILDDKSPLADLLDDHDCEPFDYDDYC